MIRTRPSPESRETAAKTGRRFTGMVFASIGFALKSGLALGSASFLWIMAGFFGYDTKLPDPPPAGAGRLDRVHRALLALPVDR